MKYGILTSLSWQKKHIGILLSIFFLLTLIPSCRNTSSSAKDSPPSMQEQNTLPQDFISFYDKFHTDSLYQLNHIVWPLRGIPRVTNQSVEELQKFEWKKKDWVLHSKPDPADKELIIEYDLSVPNIITENIHFRNTELRMMRRFAKSNKGEWFLIYYAALNDYSGNNSVQENTDTANTR